MEKKRYQKPSMKVHEFRQPRLLVGSNTGNGGGMNYIPPHPWHARRREETGMTSARTELRRRKLRYLMTSPNPSCRRGSGCAKKNFKILQLWNSFRNFAGTT